MTNLENKIRSDEEAKTITMMRKFGAEAADSVSVIVANVFICQWSSSLTVEKVEAIGKAIYGVANLDVKGTLTKMCRAKILRSRVQNGKRYYEVNY